MLVLLDSTVLIDHLRGLSASDRIERVLSAGDAPATTGINVEEIVGGVRPGEAAAARSLFRGLLVLPIGEAEGWQAGEWRREFARRGRTLSQADCLIAATAAGAGARLATANVRDFPMAGVDVEHWPS